MLLTPPPFPPSRTPPLLARFNFNAQFSLETAPFKLTSEMLEVLGGERSMPFVEFRMLLAQGFLAMQRASDEVLGCLRTLATDSQFPCFRGKDAAAVLATVRQRFRLELSRDETVEHVEALVRKSLSSASTNAYDGFQKLTMGIAQ